jgi:hypothetical protein
MSMSKKSITVEDVEYYISTYVLMHGPIESKENMIDMLNWVEKLKILPEDRRKKILRIKRAIHS